MIPKPSKSIHDVTFYRPISLLTDLSKMDEYALINRLELIIDRKESLFGGFIRCVSGF